ncbi:MAG: molybdopterin molybdotransferase MoeA [Blastocatellia bacterium]|nr:molybdopterin molybdotransferase MoeA [Chloracidobacterium sp.]MBL8185738.1 molybdopterin molybdotransferase MoeA [Blastocatellia bacterium]HRK50566.1 molybdopterin molybdotransferase MoeA [Pyrinomonadaceae bacterium]
MNDLRSEMISAQKAMKIIAREATGLGPERIDLHNSVGRVLAEDVVADTDMPPFDRSQMDGYAVVAADTKDVPAVLKLVGESAAGRGWKGRLKAGEAVRIMTGAPLPAGADAVQKIELTREADGTVIIDKPTAKGRFVVPKGKEVAKGKVVLRRGERLTASNIAVPAAFGYAKLKVSKRPRVAILATGTEIVPIAKRPKPDQIRNSNSLMLATLCQAAGAETVIRPTVGDKLADLTAAIASAARSADLVITTGGVSVGKYDLTKEAIAGLGAEIFFEKVKLKPGKPTVFARMKRSYFFGLPGNPVSAAVTFHLFVRRALMLMQSASAIDLPSGFAIVEGEANGTRERDSYLPAIVATDANGRLLAVPLRWHGSSDFIGFASAEALVRIPAGGSLTSGEVCEVLFL